jgi:hypothetical protein
MMLHLGVIGVKIAARLLTFSWLAFSTYPSPVDLTTRAEALAAQASSSPIHGMRPNNQVSIINHAMINHE